MSSVNLFTILLCCDTVLAAGILGVFVYYLVKIQRSGS